MLKRLEIQCVFKELVKDIVVKGQFCKSTIISLIRQNNLNKRVLPCTQEIQL